MTQSDKNFLATMPKLRSRHVRDFVGGSDRLPLDSWMPTEDAAMAHVMIPFCAGNPSASAQAAVKFNSQEHTADRRKEVNPGCCPDAARYRRRDGARGVDTH